MAAATGKRPKTSVVKQASIGQTSDFLKSLPQKPKEELTLREAIDQMSEPLRAALNKGYNYQELAAILTEKGVKISAFTLKNYVPSGKRRAAKEKAAKAAARQTRAAKVAEAAAAEEASPKKTTRGGRSATTAAKAAADAGATVKQPAAKRTTRATKPAAAKSAPARGRKKTV
jgi:hypothetical protein